MAAASIDVERAVLLGAALVLALAVWGLALLAVAVRTRTSRIKPVAAGLELVGDHSPAIVSFMVNGWAVRRTAAAATVIDLTARRMLTISDAGDDQFVIQPGPEEAAELTGYEREVVELVRSTGRGRAVPLPALIGEGSHSFQRRFTKALLAEVRSLGLSGPRWDTATVALITLLALPVGGLLGLLLQQLPTLAPESAVPSGDERPSVIVVICVAAATVGVLMRYFRSLRADRATEVGREAASRWLGLRENFEASGGFADLPPTATVVWDRYLAYAVGFGVAPRIARLLPLGPESPDEAWSDASGRWRIIPIRYPRTNLGWGRAPSRLAVRGIMTMLLCSGALLGVAHLLDDVVDTFPELAGDRYEIYFSLVSAVMALVFGGGVLFGAGLFLRGLVDVGRSRVIEGVVLRAERPWLVVDSGTSDELRAFLLRPAKPFRTRGARVRVTASPGLGFVRSIDLLPAADPTAAPSAPGSA